MRAALALAILLLAGCVSAGDGEVVAINRSAAPLELHVVVRDGEDATLAARIVALEPEEEAALGDLFDGPGAFTLLASAGDATGSARWSSEEGALPPVVVVCLGAHAVTILAAEDAEEALAPLRAGATGGAPCAGG